MNLPGRCGVRGKRHPNIFRRFGKFKSHMAHPFYSMKMKFTQTMIPKRGIFEELDVVWPLREWGLGTKCNDVTETSCFKIGCHSTQLLPLLLSHIFSKSQRRTNVLSKPSWSPHLLKTWSWGSFYKGTVRGSWRRAIGNHFSSWNNTLLNVLMVYHHRLSKF